MADTRDAIRLEGKDWEDVSALTGIATGTAIYLQSQSSMYIQIAISDTKPDSKFKGMFLPNSPNYQTNVTSGEKKVWLYGVGPVSIQEA